MADRRRRKCSDLGSDESGDDAVLRNHSDASEGANSEYESVDEDELGEEEEEEIIIPSTGDENKPLDDDEDRKNPQYIPKRGTFYEHDDRTAEEAEEKSPRDEEENEKSSPQDKKLPDPKKKVWKDDDCKWKHDRFVDYDQSPKTREELVATYGYDIRNEEGPPRARRRRRYGRGPNKYTRNWEDFDAYSRPSRGSGGVSPNPRGGGGGERGKRRGTRNSLNSEEDFPALVPNDGSPRDRPSPKVEDDQEQRNYVPTVEITISDSHNQKTVYNNQVTPNSNRGKTNQWQMNEENRRRESGRNEENFRRESGRNEDSSRRESSRMEENIRRESNGRNEDFNRREGGGRGRSGRRGGRAGPRGGSFGQQQREKENTGGQQNKNWCEQNRGGRYDNKGRGQNYGRAGSHSNSQIQTIVYHQQQKEVVAVTEELKTMTITSSNNEEHHFNNARRGIDSRKNPLPPRLQESMRGNNKSPSHGDVNATSSKPKRYSSQRQRTVQDQILYQQGYFEPNPNESGFQGNLYEVRNNASPIASAHAVSITPTQLPSLRPVNAHQSFVAPSYTSSPTVYTSDSFLGRPPAPRLTAIVTQPHLIGPGGPIAAGPPTVTGPVMPGGAVAPVSGPHFLPPENMITFAAGAPPGLVTGPHPPQFPAAAFQAFTPVVSQQQPQEIYRNGTMYYNTQSQQYIPRVNPVLQKRPKAAIPIVPPPDSHGVSMGYEDDYEDNYPENSGEEFEAQLYDNSAENYNEGYEPDMDENISEQYEDRLDDKYLENSIEYEKYENNRIDDKYPENSIEYEKYENNSEEENNEYEPHLDTNDFDNSGGAYESQLQDCYSEKAADTIGDDSKELGENTNCSNDSLNAVTCISETNAEYESNNSNSQVTSEIILDNHLIEYNDLQLKETSNSDVLVTETLAQSENMSSLDCLDANQDEFIDASEEAHQEELCSKENSNTDLSLDSKIIENSESQNLLELDNKAVTNLQVFENREQSNSDQEKVSEINLEQNSNTIATTETKVELPLIENSLEVISTSSINNEDSCSTEVGSSKELSSAS